MQQTIEEQNKKTKRWDAVTFFKYVDLKAIIDRGEEKYKLK
jgi:hypothetical protein